MNLKGTSVIVWPQTFAVVKSKATCSRAFCNIVDKTEITVIIDQRKVRSKDVLAIEKDWRLLTFDAVLPFTLVGFMAAVTNALANAGVSIMAISSYSTDHLLVKKKNLGKALKALRQLGCRIKR